MAFNQQEQQIIDYGIKNGKSQQEVMDAITRYRMSTVQPAEPQTASSNFATRSLGRMANRASEFVKSGGEIPQIPAPFNVGGIKKEGGLITTAKGIGNALTDIGNLIPGFINFLNPITNVKSIINSYQALSQKAKQNNIPVIQEIWHRLTMPGGPQDTAFTQNKNTRVSPVGQILLPQFIQDVSNGDIEAAVKALAEHPITQVAPIALLGLAMAEQAGYGKEYKSAIESNLKTPTVEDNPVNLEELNKGGGVNYQRPSVQDINNWLKDVPASDLQNVDKIILESKPSSNDIGNAVYGKTDIYDSGKSTIHIYPGHEGIGTPDFQDVLLHEIEHTNGKIDTLNEFGNPTGETNAPTPKNESLVKTIGRKISNIFIRPSESQARMLQNYEAGVSNLNPITNADTAARLGISGTDIQIGTQAAAKAKTLFDGRIEPALKSIKEPLKTSEIFSEIQKYIDNEKNPSRKADLNKAFDSIKEDYRGRTKASYLNWQEVKSSIDENTPNKAFANDRIASAYGDLQHQIADTIRQKTYTKLADVNIKQDYLDWGNLQQMQKEGVAARKVNIANRPSFTNLKALAIDHTIQPLLTKLGTYIYNLGDYELESAKKIPSSIKTLEDYIKNNKTTVEKLWNTGLLYLATQNQSIQEKKKK